MEEKKTIRISLSTGLLIIALIVIVILASYIYVLSKQNNSNKEINNISEGKNDVTSMQYASNNNTINEDNSTDTSSNTYNNRATTNNSSENKQGTKFVQFDTTFYSIEEIALEWRDSTKIKNYKDFEYDLDGDGKKDKITIRGKNVTSYKNDDGKDVYTGEYVYELNGIEFADAGNFGKIYIVDIDKNDNSIEVVTWDNGPSDDSVYRIFSKQNNKMKEILNDWTDDLYIDQLGKILPSGSFNPSIVRTYYNFSSNNINKVKTNENEILNIEFNANGCYFSAEKENFTSFISKFDENSKNIDDFDKAFEKTLKDKNVEKLGQMTTFKILKFINYNNDDDIYDVYVQLSDGRKGYIQETIQLAD